MKTPTPSPSDTPRHLEIRFEGPETGLPGDADLRRLFSDPWPGSLRRRLRAWPCILATVDGRPVALASCHNAASEMRVADFAIDVDRARRSISHGISAGDILEAVLDAIELMALAGGCRRVVLVPPPDATGILERHAYVALDAGAGGRCWFEKRIG